jgi:hypothetical protein
VDIALHPHHPPGLVKVLHHFNENEIRRSRKLINFNPFLALIVQA